MDFPNIRKPSYAMGFSPEDNSIASKFEDGSVQSRQKFTRSRRTFKLKWEKLSNADYIALETFIRTQSHFKALPFYWTNPHTSEKILVRYMDGMDSWELVEVNLWSGKIELAEV